MNKIYLLAAAVFFASSAMAAETTAPVQPVFCPMGHPVMMPDMDAMAKQQQAFFEQQSAAFQAPMPMDSRQMKAERDRLISEQEQAFKQGYEEHQKMVEEMERMHPGFGGPEGQPNFSASRPPMAPVSGGMSKMTPDARRAEIRKHLDEQRQAMQVRRDELRKRSQMNRAEPRFEAAPVPAAGA